MTSLDNYFDRIYIINLKSAQGRRDVVNEQARRFRFKPYFFEAYDRDRGKEYLQKIGKNKNMFTNKSQAWWKRLGCKISHVECLNDAVAKGFKRVLVFEDDIKIRKPINKYLDKYFEQLPDDWSIFLMGYYIKNKFNINNQNVSEKVDEHIYTLTESHGAHAIAYNIESPEFKKYLNALNKSFMVQKHYDLEMHEICNNLQITRYAAYPQFMVQSNGFSYLSEREKQWDIASDDPRFDLHKSGTVLEGWKFVRHHKFEDDKTYKIIVKGHEYNARFFNGYFTYNGIKREASKVVYFKEMKNGK